MTTPATHAERILDDLHAAQAVARDLARALEDDPCCQGSRHAFYARSLLSRLYMLESELLASPPAQPAT